MFVVVPSAVLMKGNPFLDRPADSEKQPLPFFKPSPVNPGGQEQL